MNSNRKCQTCRNWNQDESYRENATHLVRECRHLAPVVVIDATGTRTQWPTTKGTDWCGDWKPVQS